MDAGFAALNLALAQNVTRVRPLIMFEALHNAFEQDLARVGEHALGRRNLIRSLKHVLAHAWEGPRRLRRATSSALIVYWGRQPPRTSSGARRPVTMPVRGVKRHTKDARACN
jgi:hypothetical protein